MQRQRVSNSEIQTFKQCRRRWWLRHIKHYTRQTDEHDDTTRPLRVGKFVHAMLEQFWEWGQEGQTWESRAEHIIGVAKTWEDPAGEYHIDDDDRELVVTMIEGWLDWMLEEGVDQGCETIATELQLEHELPDGTVYTGIIDRVYRDASGGLVVEDTKTVASLLEPLKMMQTNEAMLGYTWLLQQEYPEESVGDARYMMLRKVKRGARSKPPYYGTASAYYSRREVETWTERVMHTVHQMGRLAAEIANENLENAAQIAYPTPSRDCSWRCEFVDVCPLFDDGSRIEDAIAEHFVEFDPNARYNQTPTADSKDDK